MLDRVEDSRSSSALDRSGVAGAEGKVLEFRRKVDSQSAESKLLDMLELVRAGHVESVAIAYAAKDGSVGTGYSRTNNVGMLIGAVTLLQNRLCNDS